MYGAQVTQLGAPEWADRKRPFQVRRSTTRPTLRWATVFLVTAVLLLPGIATGQEASSTAKSIALGLGSVGQASEKKKAEAEKELLNLGGEAAKPLASLLVKTPLEGPESAQIQRGVFRAFKLLGADGRSAVSVLEKGVKKDDQSLRDTALNSLGAIGAEAEPAVPTIIETLERRKFSTKLSASAVLREILHADVRYVDMLSDRLGDKASAQERIGAALALGYLGRNDKEVMKTLAGLSKHENPTVRGNATAALAYLGSVPGAENSMYSGLLEGLGGSQKAPKSPKIPKKEFFNRRTSSAIGDMRPKLPFQDRLTPPRAKPSIPEPYESLN